MRQLFVEELKKVEGGAKTEKNTEAMRRTTLACCEEGPKCDNCCFPIP